MIIWSHVHFMYFLPADYHRGILSSTDTVMWLCMFTKTFLLLQQQRSAFQQTGQHHMYERWHQGDHWIWRITRSGRDWYSLTEHLLESSHGSHCSWSNFQWHQLLGGQTSPLVPFRKQRNYVNRTTMVLMPNVASLQLIFMNCRWLPTVVAIRHCCKPKWFYVGH